MSQAANTDTTTVELQALDDYEFIKCRVAARERLIRTPSTSSDYPHVKEVYEAVKDEHYRREHGGMPVPIQEDETMTTPTSATLPPAAKARET